MTSKSASRRAGKRREAALRLALRVVVPVGAELKSLDPLAPRGRGGERRRLTSFLVAGVALQAVVAAVLTTLGSSSEGQAMIAREERVVVRVVEPPPVEVAVAEPAAPQERREPAKEPEPARRTSIAEKPLRRDPVDAEPAPEPKAEPRRVVGLNLESTVQGGKGPAFAVGNTRMGATGQVAEKPGSVGSPGGGGAAAAGSNARADYVPSSATSFVKPKRLAEPRLEYPAALKAQGIEGDVAVLIRIGADGAVGDVRIVKGSGVPELDAAARAAAARERFSPAIRDGQPVEYTLKYTYRFRIVDA